MQPKATEDTAKIYLLDIWHQRQWVENETRVFQICMCSHVFSSEICNFSEACVRLGDSIPRVSLAKSPLWIWTESTEIPLSLCTFERKSTFDLPFGAVKSMLAKSEATALLPTSCAVAWNKPTQMHMPNGRIAAAQWVGMETCVSLDHVNGSRVLIKGMFVWCFYVLYW